MEKQSGSPFEFRHERKSVKVISLLYVGKSSKWSFGWGIRSYSYGATMCSKENARALNNNAMDSDWTSSFGMEVKMDIPLLFGAGHLLLIGLANAFL